MQLAVNKISNVAGVSIILLNQIPLNIREKLQQDLLIADTLRGNALQQVAIEVKYGIGESSIYQANLRKSKILKLIKEDISPFVADCTS